MRRTALLLACLLVLTGGGQAIGGGIHSGQEVSNIVVHDSRPTATAVEGDTSRIQYLANEAVAVFHNGTTLLFDPLFRIDFGYYQLVPESTREAMFAGTPPFDKVTAIFVSHYHDDHFDPADMLRMMQSHESTRLYAPQQAVDAIAGIADGDESAVFDRIVVLDLLYVDMPRVINAGNVIVEAFFVPHAGWPTRLTDLQNIAFRVTIDAQASVVHLGDADPNLIHFRRHEQQWRQGETDVALPPYWFFNSTMGNQILEQFIRPALSIGIHVPASYNDAANIPEDLRNFELFVEPGESRALVPGQ